MPGSYTGKVELQPSKTGVSFAVPKDAKPGQTIQTVAEATDDGSPSLTRYAKVVVTVVE